MATYSVIIVNYKTAEQVVACIHSIKAGTYDDMELIVVDNHSEDNSREMILNSHSDVQWLEMGYNSGFARANNAGIKVASGEIMLLLNPDTLNKNNAIYKCFTRLKNDTFIAAGVQLLFADGSPQISGNYFMKGGLNYLMSLPYVGKWIRNFALNSGVKKTNLPLATGTVKVDWINGAFLMVKKSVIEKAGLMDEDFFLYSEETEWCSRLGKHGTMGIYGDLNIVHLEGMSSGKAYQSQSKGYQHLSDKKGLQIMVSNFVRFRKQYGIHWYLFHLLANLITIPVYSIILILKTLMLSKGIRTEWSDWTGYSGNVLASLRFFFKIITNRPYLYKVL